MADVTIDPIGEQARWSLRMPLALQTLSGFRIALDINRMSVEGERLAARLGPDEWLLCAPPAGASELAQVIAERLCGEHHSLVDVGHRYAAFRIEGVQAHRLLTAGCPLDLDPLVFAPGHATRTLLGKAEIVLWRLPTGYRVECGRTFAPYVEAFLREAAREFTAG